MADLLELTGPGGKSETCGVTGLIGLYFRGIDASQAAVCWGTNGIDTHDTNRPDNDIKSFNSPYGERNVGHRGRQFSLWTLWVGHLRGFRSFHRQGKSYLSVRGL